MTPRSSRQAAAWAAALLLAALVAAVHLLVLRWLSGALHRTDGLRLAPPVYTVLLKPAPPPPAPPPVKTTPPAPPPPPTPPLAAPAAVAPVVTASSAAPAPSAPTAAAETASHAVAADGSQSGAPVATPNPPASAVAAANAPSAAASAAAPPSTTEDDWPPSTRLSYTLSGHWRGKLHGSGALVWTVDDGRYEVTLSGSALLSFAYRSSGRIDGDWLAPDHYSERVFTREKSVRFDRADGTVRFSASPDVVPLQPHVQDSASLFVQIAHRL
ncbi:MAG: DUF3108 domain-containing protein, partial [Thiomonas sp.]